MDDAERDAVRSIVAQFFTPLENGTLQHGRCDRELAIGRTAIEVARENGKRGGRPPKQNQEKTQRVSQKEPTGLAKPNQEGKLSNHQPPTTSNQPPVTSRQPPETTTALVAKATDTRTADPFAEAWAAYPKRLGANPRKTASAAFYARVKGGVAPATLLDATRAYAAFCAATHKVGTEFVMQGQRFYGPEGGWREDWSAATPKPVRPNDPATGRAALHDWLSQLPKQGDIKYG